MDSYLSPKTKRSTETAIHGRGLFAVEAIKKEEIVAVKSGHVLTKEQLDALEIKLHAELQVAEDLFITPTTPSDYDKSMMCINHSCNPNVGVHGNIVFVAMRDIAPGEELTMDYAIIDNDASNGFDCACKSTNCRKTISGIDWKNKELQNKYRGYFTGYIQSLIDVASPAVT